MISSSDEVGPFASAVFYSMPKIVASAALDLFVQGLKAVGISRGIMSCILMSSSIPCGLISWISSTIYSLVSEVITSITITREEMLVPDGLPWCNI